MQTPLQITFRSIAHSNALAAHVERRAERLEHLFDRIVSCHVVIKLAAHGNSGDWFHFTVHIGLPEHEIVVSYEPVGARDPESAHVSADRAFDEAERQLEDWVRRRRDLRRQPAPEGSARG
jgi:putative sigma-54 modulation protein